MNREQRLLLLTLSDHLQKRSTIPEEGIDWHALAVLADAHEVAGIVYKQCKEWIPGQYRSQFERAYSSALFAYANRRRAYQEIQVAFAENSIQSITVKGLEVAALYPIPALRTMGDLDILVHQQDKERADQILIRLGYQTKMKNPNYDWTYYRDGMEYELHHQMFYIYDKDINDPKQVTFFNDYWPYAKDGQLDWSFHFLYMLVHLKKHLMLYGAGFRMFFDLAVIMNSGIILDWPWIEKKLDEFHLCKFADVCFGLIEAWFSAEVPINHPRMEIDLLDRLTDRVARDGIFGFDNKNNYANVEVNTILKGGEQHWCSRIRVFLRNVFPPYRQIAYVKEYNFLQGKPLLLPVAWIFRFYRLAAGKTEGLASIMDRIMVSDERVKQRKKELREWGL